MVTVGSSWVSDDVGRRYSATEPCAVSPSDQARAYGLRRRRESAPGSARPNVLWVGQLILPSAHRSTVGCSAESPRVGSPLCLVQVVAEGPVPEAKPKGAGVAMEGHRRRLVRRREHIRRRRSDVEDNGHLCHAPDRADRCVMETVGGDTRHDSAA